MNNKTIDDWLIFIILGLERSEKQNKTKNTKQTQEPLKEKCKEAIKRQFRQETQMGHLYNRVTEWADLNGAQIRNGFISIHFLCSVRLCGFSLISLPFADIWESPSTSFPFIDVFRLILVITIHLQILSPSCSYVKL